VTCPVCGRKDLNGEPPHSAGFSTYEAYHEKSGEYRLVVPRHTARKMQPRDIGQASFAPHDPYGREDVNRWCDSRGWDW
jgi:rRNA maturation protein Nop10